LTHHTLRRSPEPLVQFLRSGGVRTYRYEHPEELPMHAKFILAEDDGRRWSAFGSYNLSRTSRWLNQELLMFSDDPHLWEALDRRWGEIMAEKWVKA
jgi:phosphatidylserine/phosphatidylglycerophosphate/cardiolipin synthase-like enzyme